MRWPLAAALRRRAVSATAPARLKAKPGLIIGNVTPPRGSFLHAQAAAPGAAAAATLVPCGGLVNQRAGKDAAACTQFYSGSGSDAAEIN
ncbi:hypothetical protein DFH11DRAFT_1729820 [Phellopilus nigrolimitatus]|nr:hypothetical protein DFH11DRAFT_1729820 [Phellopilus nigrolimitatus]